MKILAKLIVLFLVPSGVFAAANFTAMNPSSDQLDILGGRGIPGKFTCEDLLRLCKVFPVTRPIRCCEVELEVEHFYGGGPRGYCPQPPTVTICTAEPCPPRIPRDGDLPVEPQPPPQPEPPLPPPPPPQPPQPPLPPVGIRCELLPWETIDPVTCSPIHIFDVESGTVRTTETCCHRKTRKEVCETLTKMGAERCCPKYRLVEMCWDKGGLTH